MPLTAGQEGESCMGCDLACLSFSHPETLRALLLLPLGEASVHFNPLWLLEIQTGRNFSKMFAYLWEAELQVILIPYFYMYFIFPRFSRINMDYFHNQESAMTT